MKQNTVRIPEDENGPETEAELHAEETRKAVSHSSEGRPGDQEKEGASPQGRREFASAG